MQAPSPANHPISLEEARGIISLRVGELPPVSVPMDQARGAVLAEPVAAEAFYPSGHRSMMDGYVVREEDGPGDFRIVETIQAGETPKKILKERECMRIFTGALLPEGGNRVVMQEEAERRGELVEIGSFGERRYIREKGSEAVPGRTVLEAGSVLGAPELAVLAQVGMVRPVVFQPPVVRHIATGGELVPPEESPGEGKIRDTNTTLLSALLADAGIGMSSARCQDDLDQLVAIAGQPCDLLLISGGAGGGDFDFGAKALRELGFAIHFDRVNLRPGKPLTFATRGSQAAFVLPGNPVSHFVCFHVAVRLAVERMQRKKPSWSFVPIELKGGERLAPDPRETYWPARVWLENGKWLAAPKRWSTSGDTFSLAGTNALVRVDGNSPANGRAETLLLDVPRGE